MWQIKATKLIQGYVEPILVLKTPIGLTHVNLLTRHPDPVIEAAADSKPLITQVIKHAKQVKQLLEYFEDEIEGFEGEFDATYI